MLATHLVAVAAGTILVAPLAGILLRVALSMTGSDAVADQDIAYFVLSPVGLAALLSVGGLLLGITILEQCALMAIAAGGMHGERWRARDGIAFALARIAPVLGYTVRLVARMLIILLPFLAVAAGVAWLLLGAHDINYYLSERPPQFLAAAIIVAGLSLAAIGLLAYKLLDWAMALPLVAFAATPPGRAFAASTRRMYGRRRTLLIVLAKWAAVALVLGTVLTLALQLLGGMVLPMVHDRIRLLVPTLGLLIGLWLLGQTLVTAFTAGAFAEIITDTYARCGPLPEAALVPALPATQRSTARPSVLAAAVLGVTILAIGAGAALVGGIRVADRVEIVAHRGAAGAAPENTLAAIRRALEDGADWVEVDVQETADGEVVVVHDSDFMKLAGVPLKVWDATLEDIQAIDVGSWFSPVFHAERTPTLAAVLETVKGRAGLVIELKYYGHDVALERKVVALVEAAKMEGEVAIMSLDYDGIRKIRELRPDWRIGLLSARALGDLTALDADFLAVNMGMARPGFLRRARRAGKPVFVWTVNTPVDVSRMASLGVAGIITDEPAMARSVLEDRASLNVAQRLLVHAAVLFGREPPSFGRDDSP